MIGSGAVGCRATSRSANANASASASGNGCASGFATSQSRTTTTTRGTIRTTTSQSPTTRPRAGGAAASVRRRKSQKSGCKVVKGQGRTMMAGARLRCSRISSVTAPRPIEVKKLIEKRVFFGLSTGKMLAR